VVLARLVFLQVKKKVRAGDRDGGVALARRWKRAFPRAALIWYAEYWALTTDREGQPGEHIDLLRRVHSLMWRPVNTASMHLAVQLIRMYAKWGREQYAEEAERMVDQMTQVCGESPWVLACHADIAFLRGDRDKERALRARVWEIHPRPNHPTALVDRAVQHFDEGDPESARELLLRATSSELAGPVDHIYLSVLVENDDPALAARARAAAEAAWKESPQSLERRFDFCRGRLRDGPYADVRAPFNELH
jgi:hypothetical protein